MSSCRVHFSGYRCTALAHHTASCISKDPCRLSCAMAYRAARNATSLMPNRHKRPMMCTEKDIFWRYYTQIDICNIFRSWRVAKVASVLRVYCLAANGQPMSTSRGKTVIFFFRKSIAIFLKIFPNYNVCKYFQAVEFVWTNYLTLIA